MKFISLKEKMDIINKIMVYILITRRTDYYGLFNNLAGMKYLFIFDNIIKEEIGWDGDFETISKLKVPEIDNIFKYFAITAPKKSIKIEKINILIEYFENIDNLTDMVIKYSDVGGTKIFIRAYLDITEKNNSALAFYKKELARLEPKFNRIYDRGYIYCIKNCGEYKIGKTDMEYENLEEVKQRLYKRYHTYYAFKALTDENFKCKYYSNNLKRIEKNIHKFYDEFKKNKGTEVFIIPLELKEIII